ncbi:signal recognition particle-docking protein FtsY [Paraglaciecola aquimarina]|uniref:Signal recognition particle receptor FtsY n=1 Tax=Paraglaciecola algarum TaxID=3050085 RepID=A0ABS9D3V4_9ALTE|nr:signal recognition particle-docking protein FtsY [Paraglaciecola sp. G1-23]MCF2947440.1 signal recognition particle-docking protein FtsY [Paraglaciecola sp. G1-23]
MSKFFNWLKKDNKTQESVEQDTQPTKSANELASKSTPEIKNNDSELAEEPLEVTVNEGLDEANEVSEEKQSAAEDSQESTLETNHSHTDSVQEVTQNTSTQAELAVPNIASESISEPDPIPEISENNQAESTQKTAVAPVKTEKTGFFGKLRQSLSRTKESIGSGIISLFKGKAIDDDLFEELETQLLVADLGMNTTVKLINQLTESSNRKQLKDGEALYQVLKEQMAGMLQKVESPLQLNSPSGPFVILMVGVNGVGKTTTIGKMAKQFQQQGKKVMLAAGDTFRAAAVEQLQVWGERNDIPVVAQQTGSDSASVIFDAFQSAQAKNIDVLIADTAGRLQNKDHLMEELKKVVRVMKKISPEAPHEIMLTLDASTGQNAVSQTKLFHEAVGLTGISLTKLDGTAKGGVIFSIADEFEIPIRYIGIGEGIDDLRPFNSQDFVNALFTEPDEQVN